MARIRIGISGWRYDLWRGLFYPEGLAQGRELEFASRQFPSIEINGSFYSLQEPSSWIAWRNAVPDGFVFSVKGPRYLTHLLRLRGIESALANFFASGVLALADKLGPILWQFPPSMPFEPDLFEAFFELLPHDTTCALAMAHRHDDRLAGRTWLSAGPHRRLRHAVEVRHDSFFVPSFMAMLRRHGIALVVADTAGSWPEHEDLTADFVYVRLQGAQVIYAGGYSQEALSAWARRIHACAVGPQPFDARLVSRNPASGRDVFCYFDNDIKVHAPFDAAHLMRRLGLTDTLGPHDRFLQEPGERIWTAADLEPARQRSSLVGTV